MACNASFTFAGAPAPSALRKSLAVRSVLLLQLTVAGVTPPATAMANVPLAKAVATVPNGTGAGRRTVHGTDHPVGFAGSVQRAERSRELLHSAASRQ